MKNKIKSRIALAVIAAVAVLSACVPLYVDGAFQTLKLVFELDKPIAADEETLVHSWFFAQDVKVKKNFVQVSGRLLSENGEGLAGELSLKAQFEDAESGKKGQKVALKVVVDGSGLFSVGGKIKKNITGGDLMTVTLEPIGFEVPKGAEVTLCVDVVRKKGAARGLPQCAEPGSGAATLSALQADILTPSCARGGCHDTFSASSGLVLAEGESFENLVNVPSREVPSPNRVTPNDSENSYLIKKLRGDSDISGARMPAGESPLAAQQIDRFVRWIDRGAENN